MKQLVFLAELAQLGYTVRHTERWSDRLLDNYGEILTALRQMRGADVEYVPLFQDFPDCCPEATEYQARRLLSWFIGIDGIAEEQGYRWLDGKGRSLFNLDEFGALPVSQIQTQSLYEAGVKRQKKREGDRAIDWIVLELVEQEQADARLQAWVQQNLYARSSLKEAVRSDISWLLRSFALDDCPVAIDPNRIAFKENLVFVTQLYWQQGLYEKAAQLLQTPTDILRLCAGLTNGDISLAAPIAFPKFSRPQRQALLRALERCQNLSEELPAYKGLWLALGRYLHPGEYKHQFPKVADAFERLRNGKIRTFNTELETAFERLDLERAVELLRSRPGLFARRLHQLLHVAEVLSRANSNTSFAESILTEFSQIAPQIPLKNLLVLERYFDTIRSQSHRAIVNKFGKIRVQENHPQRTSSATNQATVRVLRAAIWQQIRTKRAGWQAETVWIDPRLSQYVLPLSDRKASEGTLPLARGSRVPLSDRPVIRLFVYWQEATRRTDLDLAVQMLGEDFSIAGHVSYTALANTGIQHSGDIQSAPHGASEFIDIQLDRLKPEWRYIAVQVYRYTGDRFDRMTCHCGWMERASANANRKTFDPKTVRSKVDLNGSGAFCLPLIVDCRRREIVYVDLYVSGEPEFNCVEEAGQNAASICQQVAGFIHTKPTFWDLAIAHLRARNGTQVESKAEATVTWGIEDCTYNVYDTAKVLSELL